MIPKEEGWYWVFEKIPPFKPQLQIVRVTNLLLGGSGPMAEDCSEELVVYQTGLGRFKELSKFDFIVHIEKIHVDLIGETK